MTPRIAIPMPHSSEIEYAERAIQQYEHAVRLAMGEPVRIPLNRTVAEVRAIIDRSDGVLLPGSKADVDPARFQQQRSPHAAPADPRRDEVDELLLHEAFAARKPVLGICYGLQTLNVFRKGSLIQHIPDFLPEAARCKVDHDAGRNVAVAHTVEVVAGSTLAEIVKVGTAATRGPLVVPVNSSHHQSVDRIGEGLRVAARCPSDGIIEAVEGFSPEHFVLAVQWHPERSVEDDEPSRAIFRALIEASRRHQLAEAIY